MELLKLKTPNWEFINVFYGFTDLKSDKSNSQLHIDLSHWWLLMQVLDDFSRHAWPKTKQKKKPKTPTVSQC